jgi:hypothetical protein
LELGKIDREHSAVTAAVIAMGGSLGMGKKRITIPINQINIAGEAPLHDQNVNDEIKNAPAFDLVTLQ